MNRGGSSAASTLTAPKPASRVDADLDRHKPGNEINGTFRENDP
jgi:hypothetical protein